ncbi:hypothetical protein PInf_004622 [Phytophthora infestans]|nr:hypothetical protein PInf_004622 [Phytophthora infestans]
MPDFVLNSRASQLRIMRPKPRQLELPQTLRILWLPEDAQRLRVFKQWGNPEVHKPLSRNNGPQHSLCAVLATKNFEAGEVLGEYLGELEHVSMDPSKRPRNTGYRLVMQHWREPSTQPIRVAINAERLRGLMRFVNHSCRPCARFVEVSNRRRATVVVATTETVRKGEEICSQRRGLSSRTASHASLCTTFTSSPHPTPQHPVKMVKSTGSTNYKLAEIERLLELVEDHLPLGKDEWEQLTGAYSSSRARGWAEREFESLRRKFKVLYSTHKPTGKATMPPHISKART